MADDPNDYKAPPYRNVRTFALTEIPTPARDGDVVVVPRPPDYGPPDPRLAEVVFVVEATSFESFCHWEEWHKRIQWEQDNFGFSEIIGYLEGRPVNLTVTFALLGGHRVMFWDVVSQVTDSVMTERWLEKNVPAYMVRDAEGRVRHSDSMNFVHCIHYLQREFGVRVAAAPVQPVPDVAGLLEEIEKELRRPTRSINDEVLADVIRDKLAALRLTSEPLPSAERGWQPIETAPKNGTEVLVWVKRAGLMGRMVAHYTSGGGEEQPRFGPDWYFWSGYGFSYFKEPPTHWMPLPEPPAHPHPADATHSEGQI